MKIKKKRKKYLAPKVNKTIKVFFNRNLFGYAYSELLLSAAIKDEE